MNIRREEIAPGVFFGVITDKRFKSNHITFSFLTRLSAETAAVNALIPNLLSKSSADYPTFAKLSDKLSSLYATQLSASTTQFGDVQVLLMTLSSLDDTYALDGEKITEEALEILLGCLFRPYLVNGMFEESVLELEKQAHIDTIEAELNDKRSYAIGKASELLYEGEPAQFDPKGTVEATKAITNQQAINAYHNLLQHCRIEILCTGCNDFEIAKSKFKSAFSTINRDVKEDIASRKSPVKGKPFKHVELLSVSQSKMVLGLKSDWEDKYAVMLLAKMYGGTTTSKLFLNVREKLSLCYYCRARSTSTKGLLMVDCGVESKNIEKAKEEILAQFEDMKNGNFTDEEMEYAKGFTENDLKTISDNPAEIQSWYLMRIYQNDIVSPAQTVESIKKVTRQQIIDAANSFKLDGVYVLTSNTQETEESHA